MFRNWRFSKMLAVLYFLLVGMNDWSPYGILAATVDFYFIGVDLFMMLIIFDLVRSCITGKSIWVMPNSE